MVRGESVMVLCSCETVDLLGADVGGHGLTACRGQYRMPAWRVLELVELEVEHRARFAYRRVATTVTDSAVRNHGVGLAGVVLGRNTDG